MNFESLPTGDSSYNYGALCHRQYADRLREALLPSPADGWVKLAPSGAESHGVKPKQDPTSARKCTLIPTPLEKGQRKDRTGFTLFVIHGAVVSPGDLPPMVRKQISWAGRLTHQAVPNNDVIDGNNNKNNLETVMKPLTNEIWKELGKSFDIKNDFLRIDVQPKSYNLDVCTAFTTVVNEMEEHTPTPVKLACSAKKVSHVVNIIIQSVSDSNTDDAQSTTIQKIYWGISNTKEHFEELNQRLNDNATSEVVLMSTCPKTGLDSGINGDKTGAQWDAPVSRAYYKLAQVFEDDYLIHTIASLQNNGETLDKCASAKSILSHGAGMDIGASPGGWTQVLHNTLGLPTVVAIDPGILAQRVMALQGVRHIHGDFTSEESIKVLATHAPYSVIVCDASVSNPNELLVKIVETLERVSSLLKTHDDDDSNGNSPDKNVFVWPLCIVITLKLPYKTEGSMARHLEKAMNYIPDYLKRFALLGSSSLSSEDDDTVVDGNVRYKICHLFANSISERTLIAVFDKKK